MAPPPAGALEWAARAHSATIRGDDVEADRASAWLVRVAPADPRAWRERAEVLVALGRPDEADLAFATGDACGPDPALREAWGLLLVESDPARATPLLVEAAAAGSWEAHAALATVAPTRELWASWRTLEVPRAHEASARAALALRVAGPAEALPDLLRSVEAAPDPLPARMLVEAAAAACRVDVVWSWARAFALPQRGDGWTAVLERLAIVSEDPALLLEVAAREPSWEVGRSVAAALGSAGRPDGAAALLHGLSVRFPDRAEVWGDLADLAESRGLPGAAALARERVGLDTSFGCAWATRAARRAGDLAVARERLDACAGVAGPEIEVERALVGLLEGAAAPAGLDPRVAGRALLEAGRIEEGLDLLEGSVRARPSSPEAWRLLVGHRPERLDDALAAVPCDPELLRRRVAREDTCDALPYVERLYGVRPADDEVHQLRSALRARCR